MCFNVFQDGLSPASRSLGRSSPRSEEVVGTLTLAQHQTATAGFPINTSHPSVAGDGEVLN